MTSLIAADEVLARLGLDLDDATVQGLIEEADAEVVRLFGAHYTDTVTSVVKMLDGGMMNLWLGRLVTSITSVVEDESTLESDDYRLWANAGRLQRLPAGSLWGDVVTVTFVPQDDTALRRGVLFDLVGLAAERKGLKSERIGEYSYVAADNVDTLRSRVLQRLVVGGGGW